MNMSGARMVMESLKNEGVDCIFGFPGGAVVHLYDELFNTDIHHLLCRHEQGAVHAADGYARATGKTGTVFVTSGPGATNTVTGIATAYMDSVPLVVFSGQVGLNQLGTDAFQEADITGITLPITKHNYLLREVDEIPRVIKEAYYIAASGRCGPVLVDLPKDLMTQEGSYSPLHNVDIPGYKPTYEGHSGQVKRAAKMLASARKPLIVAGGGVVASGAHKELLEISEQFQVPVTTTLMGIGGFPGSNPLFLGMPGMHGTVAANYAISEADLIICVGARFDDRVTGSLDTFAPEASVIHIDIDPAEIGKNVKVDIPIVGDVKRVLRKLLRHLEGKAGDTRSWLDRVRGWQDGYPLRYEQKGKELKPQYVIQELYRLTGGEAIITTDVGQHQMWTAQYYTFKHPRSFISSGGLGTMGYGFPAALGVQAGVGKRPVFCVAGDGSFLMNSQELATAVSYRLPVKIVLINNRFLGMVRQWQELFFQRRYAYTSLEGTPDFAKLAEAYGASGITVSSSEEVKPALERSMELEGPVLIDFQVCPEENVMPMVPPNTSIAQMIGGGQQ